MVYRIRNRKIMSGKREVLRRFRKTALELNRQKFNES